MLFKNRNMNMLPPKIKDIQIEQCQKRPNPYFLQQNSQTYIEITSTPLILLHFRLNLEFQKKRKKTLTN